MGGKRRSMSKSKRAILDGRGPVGKAAVAGIKDRESNQIVAKVIGRTTQERLQGFIKGNVQLGATVYTDESPACESLIDFDHESVKHSVSESVRGMTHTNGVESFWSMLKRAHQGTFHKISVKHLQRYVNEFAGRHGIREQDPIDPMQSVVAGLVGKRLMYRHLRAA